MTTPHTCLSCGLRDYDVRMALVDLADPKANLHPVEEPDQRIVEVPVTTMTDGHGRPTGMEYHQVRERYVTEPRCRDRAACLTRARAAEEESEPAEDLAWLG